MIKIYTKEYAGLLEDVFEANQHFLNTFGGKLQVADGITSKDRFMTLKVADTEAVVQEYSTDANVAFGTGTGSSNRFGERREITSVDADVEYEAPLAIHEGVDNMTVNDDADQVIEERAGAHAEAWVEQLNQLLAKALSDNAGKTVKAKDLTQEGVTEAFEEAQKEFINNKVGKDVGRTAYVNADVFAILQKHSMLTTGKNSRTNSETGEVPAYLGFDIEVLADEYFQTGENIIFTADTVGVVGVGIETYRVLDSEDFAGVAVQSAAKYGKYIPEKNKKAILKAKLKAPTA